MLHLAYLQAVEDVNNRVSRLAANVSLIRENLCPISFVDVPERAYEESCERDLVLFNYDDPARHFYEVTELFVSQQLFTATDGLNADFDQ